MLITKKKLEKIGKSQSFFIFLSGLVLFTIILTIILFKTIDLYQINNYHIVLIPFVLLSLILGLIETIYNHEIDKKPFDLWSFSHFILPLWLIVFTYTNYWWNIPEIYIHFLIGIGFVFGYEVFEVWLANSKTIGKIADLEFVKERTNNILTDIALGIIGLIVGIKVIVYFENYLQILVGNV